MSVSRRGFLTVGVAVGALGMVGLTRDSPSAPARQSRPVEFDARNISSSGYSPDAAPALRSFLERLPPGAAVVLQPGVRLRVASLIALTKPVHLDGRGAEIFTTGSNGIFAVPSAASGSIFQNLRLRGDSPRQYANQNKAFNLTGKPEGWVANVMFDNVSCEGFGYGGFFGSHVRDTVFRDCVVRNSVYCGFQLLSPRNVELINPVVDTLEGIVVNGYMQSYPVAWTRDSRQHSILDYPNAINCTTWGGLIRNCGWEGVDTHGGINIKTIGTQILDCMHGVAYVSCPDENGDPGWAPQGCVVAFCRIESRHSDASKATGVKFAGAGSRGQRIMAATGQIIGNRIIGHGRGMTIFGDSGDPALVGGAIQLYQTDSVKVDRNEIVEPNPFGISLWYDNTACRIETNTVQDPWSETLARPAAIAIRSTGNDVTIGATRLLAGAKVARYKNVAGVHVSVDAGNRVTIGPGADFSAAAIPVPPWLA